MRSMPGEGGTAVRPDSGMGSVEGLLHLTLSLSPPRGGEGTLGTVAAITASPPDP